MSRPRPRRPATWILRLLSPPRLREEVLGDLEENYAVRVVYFGERAAQRWYWAQVGTTLTWLWWEEIETMVRMIWHEARVTVRGFVRKPAFTLVTVLTLGLAIGANTAIFSVVDGVLLEPLPFPEAGELVSIRHDAPGLDMMGMVSSPGLHVLYSQASRSFDGLALYSTGSGALAGDGTAQRVTIGRATPSLFDVLGAQPTVGRTFTEEEGIPGGPSVAIISEGMWADRFARAGDVVGRTLLLSGTTVEIVGVMPGDFAFPDADVAYLSPPPESCPTLLAQALE